MPEFVEWWYKTMRTERKFFNSDWGSWQFLTWRKPSMAKYHCVMVFEPGGFLVECLDNMTLSEAEAWVKKYEEENDDNRA